ncbi:MAG: RNase H-like domain-containing protein, partial [Bacteroidota bacterium]
MPVAPEDIHKTAVSTPFGLFEFLRMPFGLRNAGQSFQRFMNEILGDLPFVFVFVDDIFVGSPDETTHLECLEIVFKRLMEHGLRISFKKCAWMKKEVDFLGFRVSSEGIVPKPDKVADLVALPSPVDYKGLRRVMGMFSFYRHHISGYAELVEPLQVLLNATQPIKLASKMGTKNEQEFDWNDTHEAAFRQLKEAIANSTVLGHLSNDSTLTLTTDASGAAIGAVLHEVSNDDQKTTPIAFFSRRLSPAERNYSVFDRELLAIYAATLKFQHYIEGKRCVVFTDQKPLISSFTKQSGHSPRQTRQLSLLSEFIDEVIHVAGKENVVADTLSRPDGDFSPKLNVRVNSVLVDVFDLPHIAGLQDTTFKLQAMNHYSSGTKEVDLGNGISVLCDDTLIPRPIVPEGARKSIFHEFHNLSHANWKATSRLICSRFTWPNAQRDIKNWCAECLKCQQNKIGRHTKPPRGFADIVSSRFTHVHMDIVGPLPPISGYSHRYIVTFIDRGTNWIEADPVSSITAESIAESFIRCWFFFCHRVR